MEYHQPSTLDQALDILAEDPDARCLAGGQTLVAMLNAELLAPSALVSLKSIPELQDIQECDDGVVIGAMVCHERVAANELLRGQIEAVKLGAGMIGVPPVRRRGTIGGSVSHADPGADYPTVLTAANARIAIANKTGRRLVPAHEFFLGFFTTALEAGEMVVAVHLDKPDETASAGYRKIRRGADDFATASIALSGKFAGDLCEWVSVAIGGCGPTPVRSEEANTLLSGARLEAERIKHATELLVGACDPIDDVRGSAEYRRTLVRRVFPNLLAEVAKMASEK